MFTAVESVKIKNKIAMISGFFNSCFQRHFYKAIYGYVNMDMGIFIMQYMEKQYYDNV